jgi:tRNA (cmo5U34)-methyltransferase
MTSDTTKTRQRDSTKTRGRGVHPENGNTGTKKDRLFAEPRRVDQFDFGEKTAEVFDDMLQRSVPMYAEIQRMVALLASDFATDGSNIYDLGCSTGASFLAVAEAMKSRRREVTFIGLDSSPEMLARARKNLEASAFPLPYELELADLNRPIEISNASVVLLVLTLQFIRPLYRDKLLRAIHSGLNDDGCLIVVEKVLGNNSTFNRLFIEHYYEFKRNNGYSDLEIAQKREALENVLVPYRLDENRELLARSGFQAVDVFAKWFNFCGFLAAK